MCAPVFAQEVPGLGPPPKPLEVPPPAEVQLERAPAEAAPSTPDEQADVTVTVTAFEFYGNRLFDSSTLAAQIAGFLNRPLALKQIYEAADAIAAYYAGEGYTLSSVSVPPQTISDGVIRLDVSEGRIGAVAVVGNKLYESSRILAVLGEDVRKGAIYRAKNLEAGMSRLNALPGLNAKAVLRPGAEYGQSNLFIEVKEKPVNAGLTLDNYNRGNLGRYRASINAQLNNPLGLGDQLQGLYLVSEGGQLKYGFVQYAAPTRYSDIRLLASYGRAEYKLSGAFAGFEGSSVTYRGGLELPWWRESKQQLSFNAAVSNTKTDTSFAGTPLPLGISVTLFDVGASYNRTHENQGVTQMSLTASSNFKDFDPAAPVNEAQALRLEFDLQHLKPLGFVMPGLDVYARLNTVYSPDPLPDVNPFSLGGPNNVRGFPAAEARGARGYFGSTTLRYSGLLGPVRSAVRLFFDAGQAFNKIAGVAVDQELVSGGIGLDAAMPVDVIALSAKLDASVPLSGPDPASDGDKGVRLFASFAATF
ncbi:MAG: ShlB/FhaC/HecB family hemolysin secretion/activation protein [Pseudomonadota bacterium]